MAVVFSLVRPRHVVFFNTGHLRWLADIKWFIVGTPITLGMWAGFLFFPCCWVFVADSMEELEFVFLFVS